MRGFLHGQVEHDEEFAYTCTEVEVVYEQGDSMPEGESVVISVCRTVRKCAQCVD